MEEDKKVLEEERKTPVKRVVQCGSCLRWYRKLRMYHVHFEGLETVVTAVAVVKANVDEDRLVCPKCYSDMGYAVGKVQSEDDIEIVTDPNYVQPDMIIGLDKAIPEKDISVEQTFEVIDNRMQIGPIIRPESTTG